MGLKVMGRCEVMEERTNGYRCYEEETSQHSDFHISDNKHNETEKLNPYLWLSDEAQKTSWRFHLGTSTNRIDKPNLVVSADKIRTRNSSSLLSRQVSVANSDAKAATLTLAEAALTSENVKPADRVEHFRAAVEDEAARIEQAGRAKQDKQRQGQPIITGENFSTVSSTVSPVYEGHHSLRYLEQSGDSSVTHHPSTWLERKCFRYPELNRDAYPSMTLISDNLYQDRLQSCGASEASLPSSSRLSRKTEGGAYNFFECRTSDWSNSREAVCHKDRAQSDSTMYAADSQESRIAEPLRYDISDKEDVKPFDSKSSYGQFEKTEVAQESERLANKDEGSVVSATSSTVQSSSRTTKSASTSSFEASLDSSTGSLAHHKFKKYLHNRWLESNLCPSLESDKARSPGTDEVERTSVDSVDTDEVFAEPSSVRISPADSSVTETTNRLLEDHIKGRQLLVLDNLYMDRLKAEVSPSAYIRATRIQDDTQNLHRISQDIEHYRTDITSFPIAYREAVADFESKRDNGSECSNSREDTGSKRRLPVHSAYHSAFSTKASEHISPFPMSSSFNGVMMSAQNIPPRSFHPTSPFQRSHSGTTPPSPMIPSHKAIRRYNSLGSSISPSAMVTEIKDEPGLNLNASHSDPRFKEEHPLTPTDRSNSPTNYSYQHRSLQKSISPVLLQSDGVHIPARRIHSLGSPSDEAYSLKFASAAVSPTARRTFTSPVLSSRLSPRGSVDRFLPSPPFCVRQRESPRFSPIANYALSPSLRSSPSNSSTILPSFVCPVCGESMQSYQALSSHIVKHVGQPPTSEATKRGGSLSHLEWISESDRSPISGGSSREISGSHSRSFSKSSSQEEIGGVSTMSVGQGRSLCKSISQEGVGGVSEPTVGGEASATSNQHLCKVCNKRFSRSDMLSRHMRLHTGHRPYECEQCGQVFSRSDHLHTHQRTHTGEKPYTCKFCAYAAPRKDMVTRHMRVHTRDHASGRGRRCLSSASQRQAPSTRGRGGKSKSPGILQGAGYRSPGLTSGADFTLKSRVQPSSMTTSNYRYSSMSHSRSADLTTKPDMDVASLHKNHPDLFISQGERAGYSSEMSIKSEEDGPYEYKYSPDLSIKSDIVKIPLKRHGPSLSIKSDIELTNLHRNRSEMASKSETEVSLSHRRFLDLSIYQDMSGISSPSSVSSHRSSLKSRNWSLASSSTPSYRGSPPYPPPSRDSTSSRAFSEISEMFPSPGYAGPTPVFWSPCTDSPGDVFTPSAKHQIRHFIWPSVAATSSDSPALRMDKEESDCNRY